MKKILLSLLVVGGVSAGVLGITQAFFNDTETSTGNTFVAGEIDLKIDNESYVTNPLTGLLMASPNTSWLLTDLTVEKFFNFSDLKPGDVGEDTISAHVNSNDAWLCAAARVTVDSDETCTEPEQTDETGACVVEIDGTNGELGDEVKFGFWKDDGDNVFETDESIFLSGPISGLNGSGQIALADSSANAVFGPNTPVLGGSDVYIGKGWCFGTMAPDQVTQDGVGKTIGATNGHLVRGTGFDCDGSGVNNESQTDKVVGDLQFYAVQSRNNATFTCAQNYTPVWPAPVLEEVVL